MTNTTEPCAICDGIDSDDAERAAAFARADILARHGLTETVALYLPRPQARTHAERVAYLRDQFDRLIAHAEHLVTLATAYRDVPEVFEILMADGKAAVEWANRCLPPAARCLPPAAPA